MNQRKPAVANSNALAAESPGSLGKALANRSWKRRTRPFAHYVATDVFTPDVYKGMVAQFQSILDQGVSDTQSPGKFSRNIKGYDAYALSFPPALDGPLSLFASREWHAMLARLLDIEVTGDFNGGFHHHVVGSGSGRAHNDLNPGWFVDSPRADGINVSNYDLCDYHSGQTYKTTLKPRETVRAAALLFYLNNAPWSDGDGGETGLFQDVGQSIDGPSGRVPPVNNSLLLFECTPYSYHAFLSNQRNPRNSVIMWLHRTKAEVEARWGANAIVYWPRK